MRGMFPRLTTVDAVDAAIERIEDRLIELAEYADGFGLGQNGNRYRRALEIVKREFASVRERNLTVPVAE